MKYWYSLFLVLSISLSSIAQNGWDWQVLADMPEPVSNNAVTIAEVNGVQHVYSFAGIDSTKKYSGIHLQAFRYNTITNIWDTIPSLPDTMGKIAVGASTVKNKIYIIGGYHVFSDGTEKSSHLVHIYDPETNTYTEGAPIPISIDDHVQLVWRDSLIYIITGWSDNGNVNDVQIYNPTADSWLVGLSTPNSSSSKVFGGSGVIINDAIYYLGGASDWDGSTFPVTTTLRQGVINPNDPTDIAWEQLNTNPYDDGYRMACTNHWGKALWIGGSSESYNYDGIAYSDNSPVDPHNRILMYNTVDSSWTEFDSTTYSVMDLRGIAKLDENNFIIAGGMLNNQKVSNKTYQLTYTETLGMNIAKRENDISIYPNPTSDKINVSFSEKVTKIHIIDQLGRIVIYSKTTSSIDVSTLPPALYLLTVFYDGGVDTTSFIVE
ncbi:MAG: T9SS type A sorting domain-containing protein [Bacteroidia bacterium]|nr:T9SS type A sorting domain-containing protein [Bacteroidia bacterium]